MLLEDLFHSLTARSHATDSEQSEGEGEIILRRLRDLSDRASSENDAAAALMEDGIEKDRSSGSN